LPRPIVVFLTTGRCGTQWLARNLARVYAAEAVVTHEPLGPYYRPRDLFRREAPPPVVVADHLDRIGEVAQDRTYIETGWPLFAAIPSFATRFKTLKIVHLTRHLVPTTVSHMVHQCYYGSPRDDDYTRLAALDPSIETVFQCEPAEAWERRSPFEKCLFWCTEVHLYARELQETRPDLPMHRVRAEDIFAGSERALRGLTEFLELPYDETLARRSDQRVDEWHHRTDLDFDWRDIFKHDASLGVCEELGYDLEEIADRELAGRYRRA
jgi:hypothetical protein